MTAAHDAQHPDSGAARERVAEVLAAHVLQPFNPACLCGWDWDPREVVLPSQVDFDPDRYLLPGVVRPRQHRAHVAAALADAGLLAHQTPDRPEVTRVGLSEEERLHLARCVYSVTNHLPPMSVNDLSGVRNEIESYVERILAARLAGVRDEREVKAEGARDLARWFSQAGMKEAQRMCNFLADRLEADR